MRTLTDMLTQKHREEFRKATLYGAISLESAKDVFKDWLRTVGLPDVLGTDGSIITPSIRRLLITLVDEP